MPKDQYLYNGVINKETVEPSKDLNVKRMRAPKLRAETARACAKTYVCMYVCMYVCIILPYK